MTKTPEERTAEIKAWDAIIEKITSLGFDFPRDGEAEDWELARTLSKKCGVLGEWESKIEPFDPNRAILDGPLVWASHHRWSAAMIGDFIASHIGREEDPPLSPDQCANLRRYLSLLEIKLRALAQAEVEKRAVGTPQIDQWT